MPDNGYLEFAHTADWGIHVWAEDLISMLITAAEGMFSLLEIEVDEQDVSSIEFVLPKPNSLEVLLVDFLNELLYLVEKEQVGFNRFSLLFSENQINVSVSGGKILSQSKEIKAVTFHELKVVQTERGFEAKIIFDV